MKECFLELCSEPGRFEQVNQFVFDSRKFALNNEGEQRYTDHYIIVHDDGSVEMNFRGDAKVVGVICRMLGQQPPTNASSVRGFYDEPTHVRFRRGNSRFLYDLETGERWKRAA